MEKKIYTGPYGQYEAGSHGAMMNALCEQEGMPTTFVDQITLGGARNASGVFILKKKNSDKIEAFYEWFGEHIFFQWVNGRRHSYWSVDPETGVHHFNPKLVLNGTDLVMRLTMSDMPYSNEFDNEDCFRKLTHWLRVRTLSNGTLLFSSSENTLDIAVKRYSMPDDVVSDFGHYRGFKFLTTQARKDWRYSFTEEEKEEAIKLFSEYSATVNQFPESYYCHAFENLEDRFIIAWLTVARKLLQKSEG